MRNPLLEEGSLRCLSLNNPIRMITEIVGIDNSLKSSGSDGFREIGRKEDWYFYLLQS